jgi:uncharacterized membrane protein
MKLDHEVIVNKPIEEVWDHTNDRDHLALWLNDFLRYEQVSGDPADPKVGDRSNMTYQEGKGEFTMLEEIIEWDRPDHLKLLMTSKMFDLEIVNDFETVGPNQTRLFAGAEFVRLGLLMRVIFMFTSKKKYQADHERQINKLKELIEAA